jgi:hypothetical protein
MVLVRLLLSALAASLPLSLEQDVRVPHAFGVEIDGGFRPGEWDRAAVFSLDDGTEVRLQHDGRDLYLGLRAEREILGSLCLVRGDTVSVLHASHALGRATYARGEGGWQLVEGFTYGMREADHGDVARAKRAEYFADHGWLASTTRMGEPTVREYRISGALLGEGPVRVGVAYLATGQEPHQTQGWPVRDDCAALELVRGATPDRLDLRPLEWARLELIQP